MKKVIHYCWFGDKPLSKMAKKCIKSWRKYLPEYEIIQWNEKNFDVNICPFVIEAYKNKKWAFVSDYARLYALYKYGGIYLDTDMEITKRIDKILNEDFFIGYEENKIIAAGIIGVKKNKNKYIKQLLDVYDKKERFDINNMFSYAIPKVITSEFAEYKKESEGEIDIIDNKIKVYPSDYFYPINYNYSKKNFTENTCMIHYYNATWAPKGEKIAVYFLRKFGVKFGTILLKEYYNLCKLKNYIKGFLKRRYYRLKEFYSINFNYKKRISKASKIISEYDNSYLVIYHPDWLGLSNVVKDNFKNILPLREQHTKKEADLIAGELCNKKTKLVIFNGFASGWEHIAEKVKEMNADIVIKVLWHGSNALLTEEYDFEAFMKILKMQKNRTIDEIGFVKESMYKFYKEKGYKCSFVMNQVNIINKEKYKKDCKDKNKIHIGLYSSGNRWVKNTYNQISAVSLVKNAILDCVPITYKLQEIANEFNLEFTGIQNSIPREELFGRIAKNDVNMYVTFTECAPLLPLESLELGVPCITGDNHHYFTGTELEKYLVVNKEDNIMEIYNRIINVLENRDYILSCYQDWKKDYIVKAKKSIEAFIKL